MPFPNEHAARQTDPGQYKEFRRTHPKGFPDGIDAIFGIKGEGKNRTSEIQTLRFDKKKWTPEAAKKWLKKHNFKTTLEVAAKPKTKEVTKDFWNGVL